MEMEIMFRQFYTSQQEHDEIQNLISFQCN